MPSPFVEANWIWPDFHGWDTHNRYALFRKPFALGRLQARAPVFGIGPYLQKGANLIAVRANNPGRGNFQYLTQGWAGLLAAAQRGETKIVSDTAWKSIRQASVSRDTVPTGKRKWTIPALEK